MNRTPLCFDCDGAALVGMMHAAPGDSSRGVVIVVGGPQYRVGSHRHFYLLADYLAERGIPTLRFDYRGMGDSEGEYLGFEHVDRDIGTALDEMFAREKMLKGVVLVGLCDAASAIMMYAHTDPRVAGIAVMNPWVRSDESIARVTVKRYYVRRVFSRQFWGKLFSGDFRWRESARSLLALVSQAFGRTATRSDAGKKIPYQQRMLAGMQNYPGRTLLITSGEDMTAAEFLDLVSASKPWQKSLAGEFVSRRSLADANHTFSSARWREQVNDWIGEWLTSW